MQDRELVQLNIDLSRQLLSDYQALQQKVAFLERQLRRTESFLEDARRQGLTEQRNFLQASKEKDQALKLARELLVKAREATSISNSVAVQIFLCDVAAIENQLSQIEEIPF